MALDAGWRDAQWGERHALYARLFPTVNSLDETVGEFARTLAGSNPDAVARIKRITWPGADDFPRLLEERAALSGTLVLSDYTRRAIAAFSARG